LQRVSEPETIRDADPGRDAAACAAIYAPHVEESPTSFEEGAPSSEQMADRMAGIVVTHPWLIAERGRELTGYAYACRHRERPAYRWATDVSVYVAEGERRRGVGRRLYKELLTRLRAQGFRVACAGITLPNEPSILLHEGLGFIPVGVFRSIGWKAGDWRDVGWWELDLGAPASEPPTDPLPPLRG
jgi:L-amino acid N-acyltransferase YncA